MTLEPLAEDWHSALAIVAHPDDMEYGAASAVARWTSQGKHVAYLLVTRGEAGIDTMPPEEVVPIRAREQRRSCEVVGVRDLEFLDHPDGLVEEGVALRRDLALAIRRHRPDVIVTINHRESWGGPSWNHADHRAVGRAVLDAARDAANRWLFRGGADDPEPHRAQFVAVSSSPAATHYADVTDHLDAGVESLRCHELYLRALGQDDPDGFLRGSARATGEQVGVEYATTFEVIEV
jgi:LmbE family N-acetylglucosaminyl deacetylase